MNPGPQFAIPPGRFVPEHAVIDVYPINIVIAAENADREVQLSTRADGDSDYLGITLIPPAPASPIDLGPQWFDANIDNPQINDRFTRFSVPAGWGHIVYWNGAGMQSAEAHVIRYVTG